MAQLPVDLIGDAQASSIRMQTIQNVYDGKNEPPTSPTFPNADGSLKRRSFFNRAVYNAFHRNSSSAVDGKSVNKLKSKFENGPSGDVNKRHSYPRVPPKPTNIKRVSFVADVSPVPAPRQSLTEPPVEVVTIAVNNIVKEQVTPVFIRKAEVDQNSNYLKSESTVFAEPEGGIILVSRASSTDSIDKIVNALGEFSMDPSVVKKRSNSFKKIRGLFGKDKKSEKKVDDEKKKTKKTENAVFADNVQNETFNKQGDKQLADLPAKKYTQDIANQIELEKKFAQMHINRYNEIKANFDRTSDDGKYTTEDYVCMDNTNQVMRVDAGQKNVTSYMNTSTINKYIDTTSSSSNTLDSDKVVSETQHDNNSANAAKVFMRNTSQSPERYSATPPRAYETYQNVQLVKPKALIPINSERPLPNPYHESKLRLDESIYGTVYDKKFANSSPERFSGRSSSASPKSPTLESSKLKLPPNRERVELQPRLRSPIPPSEVSTDKIIATELLKTKKEKKDDIRSSPSHQRLEIEIDYPDGDIKDRLQSDLLMVRSPLGRPPKSPESKPPISPKATIEAAEWHRKQRELAKSPSIPQQVTTNAIVHADSQYPQISSGTNTPVMMRSPSSSSSLQRTPPKHEIRKSVEAFCWKELKKMKEQKDFELQKQLQLTPFGFAEEPVISRRSRSPTNSVRSSRRSSSLPREVHQQRRLEDDFARRKEQTYGQLKGVPVQNPNFVRNSPQRSTIESSTPRGYHSNYKPIFRRGSLSQQPNFDNQAIYNKKVSFHNSNNQQVWPTRNGFTQSPPQRRVEGQQNNDSVDDEVFVPDDVASVYSSRTQGASSVYGYQLDKRPLTSQEIFFLNQQRQKEMLAQRTANDSLYATRYQIERERMQYANKNGGQLKPIQEPVYGSRSAINEPIYGTRPANNNVNPMYGSRTNRPPNNEALYDSRSASYNDPIYASRPPNGRPVQPQTPMRNHMNRSNESTYGSKLSINEPNYVSRQPTYANKANGVSNIIREPIYETKQEALRRHYPESRYDYPPSEPSYDRYNYPKENMYGTRRIEPIYEGNGPPDAMQWRSPQPRVNNKVCDFYGQIHDPSHLASPPPSQRSGVLYGQLQRNANAGPIQYQSYNPIQPNSNFVRGTRLTASVNDMHRRYPTVPDDMEPPNRPLPLIPNESKSRFLGRRRKQSTDTGANETNARITKPAGK